MESKKLSENYQKRIVVNLGEYEYTELVANLKSENIKHPAKMIRFFIDLYLSGDKNAREVIETYKQKNKIAGRAKKEYVVKQEELAKKSESLYSLNDDDIDDIYDLLDEDFPDWGIMNCDERCEKNKTPCEQSDCRHFIEYEDDLNCVLICTRKNGPLTLEEVSKRLGVSYVRVKQIEEKAFSKIKSNHRDCEEVI